MADAAPAAPKPAPKKASKPKKPVEHPGFTAMITEAVVALKEVGRLMAHCFAGLAASFQGLAGRCLAEMIEPITMHQSRAAGRPQTACTGSSDPVFGAAKQHAPGGRHRPGVLAQPWVVCGVSLQS
jgi:hypothetical protein